MRGKRLTLWLVGYWLAFLGVAGAVRADVPQLCGAGQVLEVGGTGTTAVGTCADGRVLYDANGVIFCGSRDTDDPSAGYINGPDCWAHDATCTAANVVMCGGSDTKQLTSVNGTNCGGTDTVTVTCDGAANVLTHGVDFTCGGTDAACATAIAAAIDALGCADATAVTTTVGVQPAATTCKLTLASSDATCATASNGTDGVLTARSIIALPDGTDSAPALTFASDTDTGIYSAGANTIGFVTSGVLRAYYNVGTWISTVPSINSGATHIYNDNVKVVLGTSSNYWLTYTSASTAYQLVSTNIDGGGTDGVILYVVNGTPYPALTAVAFANLGTPANGTFTYCSDCTIANPCAGSGTGAIAKRLNGIWVCN